MVCGALKKRTFKLVKRKKERKKRKTQLTLLFVWKLVCPLAFWGVVSWTVWRKCGRREGIEWKGRREEGPSMLRGFLKGILSSSRHLPTPLIDYRKGGVSVPEWLPEWCVFSSQEFVLRRLPRQQEPQIAGTMLTRLPGPRLSQAAVYDSWWSELPLLLQFGVVSASSCKQAEFYVAWKKRPWFGWVIITNLFTDHFCCQNASDKFFVNIFNFTVLFVFKYTHVFCCNIQIQQRTDT